MAKFQVPSFVYAIGFLAGSFWLGTRFESSRVDRYLTEPYANAEEFLAEVDELRPLERDYLAYARLLRQGSGMPPDLRSKENVPLLSCIIKANRQDLFRRVTGLYPHQSMTKDSAGRTPLHYAAASDDSWFYLGALGPELLDAGENKDNRGRTPLHEAAERDDMMGVMLLAVDRFETDSKDKDGNTALHLAILSSAENSIGSVMTLIRESEDMVSDGKGRTPLLLAADLQKWHLVGLLSRNGDNPNAPDRQGRTARAEIKKLNPKLYRELVPTWRKNGFVTDHDERGRTPMMQAVDARNWKRVELLSEAGADPNAVDERGRTPRQEIEKSFPSLHKKLLEVWDKNCYNTAWENRQAELSPKLTASRQEITGRQ